ncbi:hypothetical protein [Synechocystis sp. PCC 7509]|uniref:hypothetical protein n=1 Tax=Synechocystis sp. PCC 7509 TaxID=927677 RepID=UPI0002ABBEAE|nr:hypothetical protein [Synechocystis sp. PCC 7509]
MASITIDISESQLQKLQDLAKIHGIPPEALLRASVEDLLTSAKSDFTDAANYVLNKNAELYRRLA